MSLTSCDMAVIMKMCYKVIMSKKSRYF